MLNAMRQRAQTRQAAEALISALSTRARLPVFYRKFGVADTIDGRFDLLVLHAWLVLERLSQQKLDALAQALIDGLFIQFDEALREQGAGDMGMSRRMTKMADAFYGRLKAYGEAADVEALAEAIVRNVYRGDASRLEEARALAISVAAARVLVTSGDLSQGAVDFGPSP
jgi:cytochrome b pre-mRNA-processing protein 3